MNMPDRIRKLRLLFKFSSNYCPACTGFKSPNHWLCEPCQHLVDDSPENAALTAACLAHVEAAENLIETARRHVNTSIK